MAKLTFQTYGNEKQKECFRYLLGFPEITEIGYGGAAGGGKSYTGVSWCWMMCSKYAGVRYFFGRQELKRLKQTTLATYFKFCADYDIPKNQRGVFNAQDSVIRFTNGSEILLLDLAYLPSDPLYTRFGSLELTGGFIDESAEIDEQCVTILMTRIGRQRNDEYGLAPKILEGFNPDKGMVYRRYYKPWKDGTLPPYRKFIPALATDNKRLPKSYIEQLSKADEVTKQRLLYGNFDYDDTPGKLFEYDKLLAMQTNPKYLGETWLTIDVAREGKDKSVMIIWDGYDIKEIVTIAKSSLVELAEKCKELAQKYKIPMSRTIADESGVGGGIVDMLRCVGFISNAKAIDHSKGPQYMRLNYDNLKAQCVHKASLAVNDNKVSYSADSVTFNTLVEELDSFAHIDIGKDGPFKIIKKEDQKKKLGKSPDFADAFIFRFMFGDSSDAEILHRYTSTFSPILGFDPFEGNEDKKKHIIQTNDLVSDFEFDF